MAQKAKDYEMLHCKLEKSIAEQLNSYAEKTRRSKTAVVELALQDYFRKTVNIEILKD